MPKLSSVIEQVSGAFKMVKGKDVDVTDADLMGSALEDNDLILIDDGAAGTQASTKKSVVSRVWDYIVSKLSAATSLTVGNYTFDADQTVGAGQDNYVLTYDNGTGNISLEATPAADDTNITVVENASTVTIQSSTGTNDDIQSATTSLAGVMSATDKTKLDGIEASADVTNATNVTSSLVAATSISGGDKTTIQGNLDVDPSGTDNSTDVTLTGTPDYITISGQVITRNSVDLANDITGTLPVANGGTGSTTAADARSALGVDAAGTDNSTNVTLATVGSNYLSLSGQEITAGTVPLVLGGTGATTAAAARTNLDVDQAGTDNSTDVTLAGTPDYITISGQTITRNAIDLAADVTGTLPVADGGTGATSFTDKSVVITQDTGTDTLSAVAMATNGQLLIGGTSGPAAATLTQGSNVTITNADGAITIASSHPNISAAASSDNSGRTYIQDITLDSDGHVTGLATATETVTNTDSKITDVRDVDTSTTISDVSSLRFTGELISVSGTSPVATVTANANIERLSNVDDTIAAAAGDVLIYNATSSKYEPQNLTAGTNVTITNGDGSITIASTDTNTQLSQEEVEDYVGGLIVGGTDITATYNDSAGTLTIDADDKTSYYPSTTGLNTDGEASGEIVYLGSTTGLTAGAIYYFNSSGGWTAADADAVSSASGLIAMSLGTQSATDGMLLRGFGTVQTNLGTVGSVVYLSTDAANVTETAPSGTGDVVRVLGYTVDATNDVMYFNPSPDWIELA